MEKIKQWLSRPQVWGFFVSLAVILAVSVAFFYPDNFDGRSLRQADMQQGAANGQEAKAFKEATGEQALWTDALFGGMPTFQISPTYPSNALFDWLNTVYGCGLPAPSNLLFMMMTGFLILLFAMEMRWYYALIGSLMWGLSSYFIIIIGAGHIWKFVALTYIPPTIAGLVLAYRGRYLTGAALTALFAMLQLNANHPQMTYYFAFVMAGLVIAWLVEAVRSGNLRRWSIASAAVLAAGMLAVGANLPSLYNTYEYSKETKRSQSELTPLPSQSGAETDTHAPTGGMPYNDIMGWCYGRSETFSLLVPNIKGGASARPEGGAMVYMSLDRLPQAADSQYEPARHLMPYLSQYFNDSEGTNGPVYAGAAVCLLFLLGCIVVKGPVKWALVSLTVLSVLLAWGINFPALSDLFIYHFPMYNKFRAVESILVIAEFTMPLLAVMGLAKALSDPEGARKPLLISTGICVAVCAAAWLVPSIFGDAITSADRATSEQICAQVAQMGQAYGYNPAEISQMVYQYSLSNPQVSSAVTSLRYGMLSADGLRSLIFVLAVAAALYGFDRRWWKRPVALAIVGVAVLTDLYGIDKRYVASDSFANVETSAPEFTPDGIDQLILTDTAHFRVMDIPGFSRPNRSYFHHMIGGYHAAKLNRYEDLIQRKLSYITSAGYYPELRADSARAAYQGAERAMIDQMASAYRVMDMLNARYVITGDTAAPVVMNTYAMGPAWLVGSLTYVDGADAEMKALDNLDPASEAVADSRFRPALGDAFGIPAPGDTITLTSYTPNRLAYTVDSHTPALAVFSEVWFPWGWKATLDGKPAQLGRVNYVLRAMAVPAGHHEIVMTFDPDSLAYTGAVAYVCVTLIYLLVLGALFLLYIKGTKAKDIK